MEGEGATTERDDVTVEHIYPILKSRHKVHIGTSVADTSKGRTVVDGEKAVAARDVAIDIGCGRRE